jgi:hypothetical protein
MTTIPAELAALLSRVQRPGDYCVAGTEEIFAPGLVVDGVGPIALPLLPVQAEALVAMAEPAPYGRGEQTLHDEAVRRTWQIAADKLRFTGRHWPTALAAMVERAVAGLGVSGPVEAELYKLLVYDEGCFFVSHRDTEKAVGMAELSPAATRLREVCLAHLRARIAEPLAPPTDWTRPASLTCDCPRCAELGRFLADPGQETWVLKAAQHDRSHVENTIRGSHSDVDTTTEKRGSPHRLIATKNQASYHRRVRQRRKDQVDLAGLEG